MKVLNVFPPMYAEINKAFDVRGKPVIFSWGDRIYNPGRIKIPPELMVHEAVHGERQAGDPGSWWQQYIRDQDFRLAEEIPAHAAEFAHVVMSSDSAIAQERMLHRIAARLSSPLYGSMIDYYEARFEITKRVERS